MARLVLVAHLIGLPGPGLANPRGGTLVAGGATIDGSVAGVTHIRQSTDRAILEWRSFGNAAGETVRFTQPGPRSAALNRVTGADPSVIAGQLTANGRVWLLNPNGVGFGRGAQVQVGGLVASTLDTSNADFLAGRAELRAVEGRTAGAVVNQGRIETAHGGHVALVGGVVSNQGTIDAPGGQVALVAGREVRLSLDERNMATVRAIARPADVTAPDGAVSEVVTAAVSHRGLVPAGSARIVNGTVVLGGAEGLAMNEGTITVAGGRVGMHSAQATVAAPGSLASASAATPGDVGGEVRLHSAGRTLFARESRLEARGGEGGQGGFVEVSGDGGVTVRGTVDTRATGGKTGTFLIDPTNLTITGGGAGDQDSQLALNQPQGQAAGEILRDDASIGANTISDQLLELQTSNILLEAQNTITLQGLSDPVLNIGTQGVSITLRAITGDIVFADTTNHIQTQSGDITLEAGRDVILGQLSNQASQNGGVPGAIRVTAGRDVTFAGGLGQFNFFGQAGNVTVSAGGSITRTASGGNGGFIQGQDVRLEAPAGNLTLGSVSSQSVNSGGVFSGGALTLIAGGNIGFNDPGASFTANGGPAVLNAGGSIALPNVSSNGFQGTPGSIQVTAGQGVTYAGNISGSFGGGDITITAGSSIARAAGGGGQGFIQGRDVRVEVRASDLTLGGVNAQASTNGGTLTGGNLTLTASRDIGFNDPNAQFSAGGASLTVNAGRNASLPAVNNNGFFGNRSADIRITAGDDLTLASFVGGFSSQPGDVTLTATRGSITQTASNGQGQVSGRAVNVTAGLDASLASVNASGGDLAISATRDVVLASQNGNTAAAGSGSRVLVTAGRNLSFSGLIGALFGPGGGGARGADVTVTAAGTIADTSPLNNQSGVQASNGGSISIRSGGSATLSGVNASADGNTGFAGGNVDIQSGGDLTVGQQGFFSGQNGVSNSGGGITIRAAGSATLSAVLSQPMSGSSMTGGEVDVRTGRDLTIGQSGFFNDNGFNQFVVGAQNGGSIRLEAPGNILLGGGGTGDNRFERSGDFTIIAGGDLTLGGRIGIDNGNASNGVLTVTAGGSILNVVNDRDSRDSRQGAGGFNGGATHHLTAGANIGLPDNPLNGFPGGQGSTFTAGGGIHLFSGSDRVDEPVTFIDLTPGQGRGTSLTGQTPQDDVPGIVAFSLSAGEDARFKIQNIPPVADFVVDHAIRFPGVIAGGNVSLEIDGLDLGLGAISGGGTVTIKNTGGAILHDTGSGLNVRSGGASTLSAAGVLGTVAAPVTVAVGGTLTVDVRGLSADGAAGALDGTAAGGLRIVNIPDGPVFFNGIPLAPGVSSVVFASVDTGSASAGDVGRQVELDRIQDVLGRLLGTSGDLARVIQGNAVDAATTLVDATSGARAGEAEETSAAGPLELSRSAGAAPGGASGTRSKKRGGGGAQAPAEKDRASGDQAVQDGEERDDARELATRPGPGAPALAAAGERLAGAPATPGARPGTPVQAAGSAPGLPGRNVPLAMGPIFLRGQARSVFEQGLVVAAPRRTDAPGAMRMPDAATAGMTAQAKSSNADVTRPRRGPDVRPQVSGPASQAPGGRSGTSAGATRAAESGAETMPPRDGRSGISDAGRMR